MAELLQPAPIKDNPIQGEKGIKEVWVKWFSLVTSFITLNNLYRTRSTTRITSTDSPYTMLATVKNLKCDTDGGAITVLLEAGTNGTKHKISNDGTSGNDVTVTPNGTELLYQVNGSEALYDAENFDLDFQTVEGWS